MEVSSFMGVNVRSVQSWTHTSEDEDINKGGGVGNLASEFDQPVQYTDTLTLFQAPTIRSILYSVFLLEV